MATIIIRNSTGSGAVPSSLVQGELAINTVDGKLFYGSGSGNVVKEFIASASSAAGGSNTQIQYNNAGALAGVPVLTYNGTTLNATGSFSGSLTGSLFGTASWATNALTASFLNTLNQNLTFNGNLTLNGTASISTLVVNQTVLSTGSNQLGDAANDTQTLYGSVIIPTGSLTVTGSSLMTGSLGVTGSINVNGRTGTGLISVYGDVGSTLRLNVGSSNPTKIQFTQEFTPGTPTEVGFIQNEYGTGTTLSTLQDIIFKPNSTERARIIGATGNFIVGTTTDLSARLGIRGSGATSATTTLRVENTNASASLVVLDNGNVGIGNTAPSYPLHITRNTTNNYIQLSGDTNKGIFAEGSGLLAFDTLGNLNIYTGGVNLRATFSSSGSLGIGTSTPTASLHISASTSDAAYSFLVQNSSGQTLLSAQNNRTVYINATNTANGDTAIGTTNGVVYINTGYNNAFRGNSITFYGGGDASTIQGWTTSQNGIAVGYAQTTINPNIGSVFTVKGTAASSGSGVLFVTGSSATRLITVASEASSSILVVSGSGNVGIGTSTPGTQLEVRGADTSFVKVNTGTLEVGYNTTNRVGLTQNIAGYNSAMGPNAAGGIRILGSGASYAYLSANGTSLLLNGGGGNVGIGTLAPSSSLHVAGTTRLSGSFNTAASGSILTVIGSGSTQPIFTVQGSQGELFSITDSLSGSLFSVNDISGLPILEVFSDNTTLIGDYQDPMLITTKKVTMTNSGSFVVYSLPTASYDTAFFDYSIKSGSNARAGQIMAIQSGSSVNFTETTTTDFGSTTAVSFTVLVSGSNMVLTGSAATGSWTIKTIVRGL